MIDKSKGGDGKKKEKQQFGVVQDPRFSRIHVDPRFRKFPKRDGKVEIDDRFASKPASDSQFESALSLHSSHSLTFSLFAFPTLNSHRDVHGRTLPDEVWRG